MNKLINTDVGGYPFVLDDLRFMDDSVRDAFKGSFYHLIDSTLVNDGFIFDKNTTFGPSAVPVINASDSWIFPETYAFLNDEILLIPQTVLASTFSFGDFYCLEIDASFTGTTPGLKTFQDATSKETYQLRVGKLTKKSGASMVLGTDILILIGIGSDWQYINNGRYSYRTREILGLNDLQTTIEDNETRSFANQNEITSIYNSWNKLATSSIQSKIKFNSSTVASASGDTAISGMDHANSQLKFKLIGKTLFVDFYFKDITIPTYATSPVSSFIVDLSFITGLNNILKFSAQGKALESVYSGTLSGSLNIENHSLSTKKFLLSINKPHGDSRASFNREYQFDTTGAISVSATLDTDRACSWTLFGSFTCEIS